MDPWPGRLLEMEPEMSYLISLSGRFLNRKIGILMAAICWVVGWTM